MAEHALIYDADCGPCTRFKRIVDFLDLRGQIEFVSLQEADASGVLDPLPRELRQRSFHIVGRDGSIHSASDALAETVDVLLGGRLFSTVIRSLPLGERGLRFFYATASRVHNTGNCKYPSAQGSVPPRRAYVLPVSSNARESD